MTRAVLPAAGLLLGAAISAISGVWGVLGLLLLVLAGAALANAPVLGTGALVALAQLDGIALIVDRHLPASTFKITTVLLLLALLLTLRRNPLLRARMRLTPVMAFSLLFALWIVIAHLFSTDRAGGQAYTSDFLQTMTLVPLIGLSVANVRHLRYLVLIIAASGAISALFVILDTSLGARVLPYSQADDTGHWRGVLRSSGASAYNPTTAAQLMAISLLVAATMIVHDARRRLLWALIALICMVALPKTGARSAILAVLFGFAVLAFSLRKHRLFPRFAAASVLVFVALLPLVPDNVWARFADLQTLLDGDSGDDLTLMRRVSYHTIGFDVWAAHPITGAGPGTFPAIYADDMYRWVPGRTQQMRQLHNSYLSVAAQMGAVGFILFVATVGGACIGALRAGAAPRTEAQVIGKSLGIGMAAFLFGSLFMPHEDNKYMWILTALCARAALLSRADPGNGRPPWR